MPREVRPISLAAAPVLVTGATGKVGRHLVSALLAAGARVAILTRTPEAALALWPGTGVDCRAGDLTNPSTLAPALEGIEVLFHLASYAPAPGEADVYEAAAHWSVTAQGTRALIAAATGTGARRLVYLSSVKAMGDGVGAGDSPADESTPPAPDTLYGRAKLEAERLVLDAGIENHWHTAVLRLPMVYGLGEQGNIALMMKAVARGHFPPWPRIENRRTAIHVDDAVRAALLVASHPAAAGQLYLVNDGRTYSTRWLYEEIRRALGRSVPRWTLPLWVLRTAAGIGSAAERLTGRAMPLTRTGLAKLTGSAWYDADKIRRELGFEPTHSLRAEIQHMARRKQCDGPK